MSQPNPNYLALVDSPGRFDQKEIQSLFGRTFSRSRVTLAGNAATLRHVPSGRGGRGGRHGGQYQRRSNGLNGNRGGGQHGNRNGSWQQNSNQGSGHHNGIISNYHNCNEKQIQNEMSYIQKKILRLLSCPFQNVLYTIIMH